MKDANNGDVIEENKMPVETTTQTTETPIDESGAKKKKKKKIKKEKCLSQHLE